jgi:hypothetical protein
MLSGTRKIVTAVTLALAALPAWADSTAKTAIGGGLGGAGGAAALGRDLNGGGNQQPRATSVVKTQAAQRVAIQEDCGSKKKKWNHPGKGWAKGHNKNC